MHQHFSIQSTTADKIHIKQYSNSDQATTIKLCIDPDWIPSKDELPEVVTTNGLDVARKWYLYNQIREFCPESKKDIVCPLPKEAVPQPPSRPPSPRLSNLPLANPDITDEPPRKKCRLCNQQGHNSRTCTNK